jgi:hypothetical protein
VLEHVALHGGTERQLGLSSVLPQLKNASALANRHPMVTILFAGMHSRVIGQLGKAICRGADLLWGWRPRGRQHNIVLAILPATIIMTRVRQPYKGQRNFIKKKKQI